ncbi:MAG: type II secretion system protein [Patescibacteria group bacterium]
MKKNKSGFTLIELLVVISIIGLLSSMAIYAINAARVKARDATRMVEIRQLKLASELYYDEVGSPPPDNCASDSSTGGSGNICVPAEASGDWHSKSGMRELIVRGLISALPIDPINNSTYKYEYEPQDKSGCVWARLEQGSRVYGAVIGEPVDVSVYNWAPFTNFPIGYQCSLDEVY